MMRVHTGRKSKSVISVKCDVPKDTKSQQPTQSQSVYPAEICKKKHKYQLLYRQNMEQLHASACETEFTGSYLNSTL